MIKKKKEKENLTNLVNILLFRKKNPEEKLNKILSG